MTPERMPRPTHYVVLGVPEAADDATIRRAYVALARQHHPDVEGGDAARMRAINEAWATLGDPVRRARYDRSLHLPAARPRPPDEARDHDLVDSWVDQLDDRPVHPGAGMPRWLSLLPAGLFAGSVVTFVVGLVLTSEPLLGLSLLAFVLSCALFLASPFIALYAARRSR